MQNLNLEFTMDGPGPQSGPSFNLPVWTADGGDLFGPPPSAECAYQNAATCPDCGNGMVRLGVCFSCPSCGFESCNV